MVEIFYLLRRLKESQQETLRMPIFNTQAAQLMEVGAAYLGSEPVCILDQQMDCFRVKLELQSGNLGIPHQFFLFGTKQPHILIKNTMGAQVIEIDRKETEKNA